MWIFNDRHRPRATSYGWLVVFWKEKSYLFSCWEEMKLQTTFALYMRFKKKKITAKLKTFVTMRCWNSLGHHKLWAQSEGESKCNSVSLYITEWWHLMHFAVWPLTLSSWVFLVSPLSVNLFPSTDLLMREI